MKNFKTKLFSLLICICLCLSIFTGCSLGGKKSDIDPNAQAITVGSTTLTQQEVFDAYYNFYQSNANYYPYYEEDDLVEIFYDSLILREIILQKAKEIVVLSNEDVEEVLNNVYDAFASQVDTIEKAILSLNGIDVEEAEGYERLKESTESAKVYKYEDYNSEENEVEYLDFSQVEEADEVDFDAQIALLKTNIVSHYYTEEDDVRKENDIAEAQVEVRKQAFEKYLSNLMFSAKANGKSSNKQTVLEEEYKRLYDSYYEGALQTKYQEYINSTTAGYTQGSVTVESKYSVEAIAKKYKQLLNASYENNTLAENYVELLTSSDNDTLILYHNETGEEIEDKYFSVQHILIEFDDETLEILKNTNGYDTGADLIYREYYEAVRALYVDESKMSVSYRDENGKVVMNGEEEAKATIAEIKAEYETELAKIENPTQRDKTMLFNKLSWKYSADTGSLTNSLSNILGFTISNEQDNHGNFVVDFTNGARDLYNNGQGQVGDYTSVVTNYGVHIMMITGVYEAGAIVDVQGKTDQEIVDALKQAYVSNMTSQTVYDYIYDILKDELVGDSGTFYTDYKNQIMIDYEENGLITEHSKLTLDQLNEAIGV